MRIKRAIGMSVLAYIASFAVGIAVALVVGIDLGETQEIPPLMWYTGAFASVVFASLFAYWYFRSPKTHPSSREGFQFGLIMIATGFTLDLLTLLPLLTHENPLAPMLTYYTAPLFWVSVALVLAATTLTGKLLAPKVPS